MSVTLTIKFEGTAPGLNRHELSLASFGPVLVEYVRALKRTASGILSQSDDPRYGAKGGRFAKITESMDLVVTSMEHNCVTLDCRIDLPEPFAGTDQEPLPMALDALEASAAQALVRQLEDAQAGRVVSETARSIIQLMPAGTTHSYWARRADQLLASAVIGTVDIPERRVSMVRSRRIVGTIAGLMFDKPGVHVRDQEGKTIRLRATEDQVNDALALRDGPVEVQALLRKNGPDKLLWVRPAHVQLEVVTGDQRLDHFTDRWGEVLERLAR